MAGPRTPPTTSRPNALRCIIISVLAVLVLVGLVMLIIYLAVRPRPIDYSVQNFQVYNFNLTPSNSLNATFDLTLEATNHNKKVSIYYDSIELTVLYSDQLIALTNVNPFYQPRRNVTTFKVRPVATGVPLVGSVAKSLKTERSKGEANWEVKVEARVRFKVGGVKSRHYNLRVDCSPVWVRFGGKAKFHSVDCDVDI